jgi:hypothetical protein
MSNIFIINNFVIEQDINGQTIETVVEEYYSDIVAETTNESVNEPSE